MSPVDSGPDVGIGFGCPSQYFAPQTPTAKTVLHLNGAFETSLSLFAGGGLISNYGEVNWQPEDSVDWLLECSVVRPREYNKYGEEWNIS